MLLSFFEPLIAGFAFILFILVSLFSIYTVFTTDESELDGFNRRWYNFSEILFWSEIGLGIVIACISVGNWLGGIL